MKGKVANLSTGAGTSAALAFTGFNAIAYIVAAFTLLFAGLALLKLVPRVGRDNPAVLSDGRSAEQTARSDRH